MKPPDHPVASGDREVARLLTRIIERLGETPVLASRLRTWQAEPDAATFAALEAEAAAEAERIIAGWSTKTARPTIWITYHLYHKAPDWIGPAVTRALDIPYVVIEASRAAKRATGPWAPGFAAADRALAAADAVAGQAERFDVMAELKTPKFPGGTLLRYPGLVAGMLFYALKDRLP